ncbi:MAG: hypothetical protein KKG50_05490 [Candidatus Omnitrophica bacterium]|nr:hypothetical protein [Candidatus Omnitrophota bacterium]
MQNKRQEVKINLCLSVSFFISIFLSLGISACQQQILLLDNLPLREYI